jgi:hypothetical protein
MQANKIRGERVGLLDLPDKLLDAAVAHLLEDD